MITDTFDLDKYSPIRVVMGAQIHSRSKGSAEQIERESARTHEFILWCQISLWRSISYENTAIKLYLQSRASHGGESILPLPGILGSVGLVFYDKRTQFAAAVVLYTLTSVPNYRQDVETAI